MNWGLHRQIAIDLQQWAQNEHPEPDIQPAGVGGSKAGDTIGCTERYTQMRVRQPQIPAGNANWLWLEIGEGSDNMPRRRGIRNSNQRKLVQFANVSFNLKTAPPQTKTPIVYTCLLSIQSTLNGVRHQYRQGRMTIYSGSTKHVSSSKGKNNPQTSKKKPTAMVLLAAMHTLSPDRPHGCPRRPR